MFKKGKGLLVLTLLIIFITIIIANAQEVPVADSFRFPLEGDWSPLWQDFNKWNSTWNGYHLGEDAGREDADKKNYAVYPMADGVVKFADVVLGYTVIIEHKLSDNDPDGDSVCSVYYHMKRPGEGGIKLKLNEVVYTDNPIGYVSGKWEDHQSSPHLHFGIRKGHYETGKDPRTGFWYYPGYTVIKKDSEVQKNPDDPIHKQILADWLNPTADKPGFIESHIIQKKQALAVSEDTQVITATIYVPDNYLTIQAAVNASNPSDTIIVRDGTYVENVEIDKSLTIKSENGAEKTIVQAANPEYHVFDVIADYVNINGLTIMGVKGLFMAGIYLCQVDHCIISGNNISENSSGIVLEDSNNNMITKNNLGGNEYYGISLTGSNNNTVMKNNISSDKISGGFGPSVGITLRVSSGNIVCLNNFKNPVKNFSYSSWYETTNIWDSTSKITYTYKGKTYTNNLGNYWEDYKGIDAGGDGIGDTPYIINNLNKDRRPLMQPFENYIEGGVSSSAAPLVLNWLSYNDGLALAEKENKYVLIDFYTDWGAYCKKMDKEAYSNEEVKKILNENFVVVKVNAESDNKVIESGEEITERELAKLYQVSGYPTTWFLESNHSRVAPLPGYVTTEQFIPVLNYIGEGWYKSISFEEYLKKI
jgi:parallel beta-helix repeat protein